MIQACLMYNDKLNFENANGIYTESERSFGGWLMKYFSLGSYTQAYPYCHRVELDANVLEFGC